jgi:hypothetical protein
VKAITVAASIFCLAVLTSELQGVAKPGTGELRPARGNAVEPLTPAPAFRAGSPDNLGAGGMAAKANDGAASVVAGRSLTPGPPDYWVREFRRRWKVERRDGRLRANTIRRLRAGMRERLELGAHGLERAFLCIHRFEGAWNDPNAPYYGGMQMDMQFQRTYGLPFLRAWGTADNWPISVQLAVAMQAYLSGRGFHPWPNTARACGLL